MKFGSKKRRVVSSKMKDSDIGRDASCGRRKQNNEFQRTFHLPRQRLRGLPGKGVSSGGTGSRAS